MNTSRHSFINKYFAFAFVVFAVLSGVSDNYTEVGSANAKDNRFSYFLNINQLLAKSSGKIAVKAYDNKLNAFHDYIQGILSKDAVSFYHIAVTGILFCAAIILNNKILQNSIWRNAVF